MTQTFFALPIVQEGQVYLNSEVNDYLVVTKCQRGHVSYAGAKFTGMQDVDSFIDRFKPVDPALFDQDEFNQLQKLCSSPLKIGFVQQ